ncbi:unnamed protein product [Lactuca virosa]|uniref:DUF659 domain-containing protein n=1 Tax=Lactuca virosa TaxID=75947 RepID=A0AAU9MRG7_9ASTR|nr:unnamed protein product [Lactuca virosa]
MRTSKMIPHKLKKRKFVSSSNVRVPIDDVYKSDHGKGKQTTLDKNNPIKEKLKKVAWKKIAVWAYSIGLPFNAVRDEGFQDAIIAIGEYGRGMPAPSYHNMRVTLLKEILEDTHKFVDSFRPQWKKFRCSIMSDFWTDDKQRSLINFLVNCPTGTVFLKSIDASEHIDNAEYIVKKVNEVIAEVGEENVVHIMTRLYVAIDRLVPDEDENDTLRQELNLYIDLNGQFGSPAAKRSMTKLAPYIWSRSCGIDTPILRNFAITVLSQTCTASPCERNWSTFDNNNDWTIPTEDELQDFVDGGDDLLWSDVQEAMGANVNAQPDIRRKQEHYRDDDDDDVIDVGNDFDEEVNALDDVDSDAESMPCD